MTQKFILSAQKTTKKAPYFQQQKPKKFTRKRSDRDRSFDSKKSKEDSVFSQYIRQPNPTSNIKFNLVANQSFQFMEQLNTSALQAQQTERIQRKTMIVRTNNNREPSRQQCTLIIRIKILETQLKAKQGECERYKLQLDQQKQRRRKAEFDRKASMKQSAAYQKQNEQLLTQIKKLNKQKQIINKQIQFLQKINYDQKTRNILSYRQQHMQGEIIKLKQKIQTRKTHRENELQHEISQMRTLKQSAQEKFRSLQSLVDVQKRSIKKLKDIIHEEQIITKQRIINSEEYCELRDRFKKFIDQYKQVRQQNTSLKSLLQNRQTQMVLSDSQIQ